MDEHPNATAYRRTADAFRAGDRETLAALIDEDVVWRTIPGSGPLAGDIATGVRRSSGSSIAFANDGRNLHDPGARRPRLRRARRRAEHLVSRQAEEGIPVSVDVVGVFHYRDGRQRERWNHPSDMAALDRLLGGPM